MLTRLMFGGGCTAQVLIMQAGSDGEARPTYGYASNMGEISPDYIMYQGEKYVISFFLPPVVSGEVTYLLRIIKYQTAIRWL